MLHFHKPSVSTMFTWGGHFSYVCKKILPVYHSAKNIKIDRDFSKLCSKMYCHLFYGSQCVLQFFAVIIIIIIHWSFLSCSISQHTCIVLRIIMFAQLSWVLMALLYSRCVQFSLSLSARNNFTNGPLFLPVISHLEWLQHLTLY